MNAVETGPPVGDQASRVATGDDANASVDGVLNTVSVAEAARLLGRDRTCVYALLRTGDLVAAPGADNEAGGPVRIDRPSLDAGWSPGVVLADR